MSRATNNSICTMCAHRSNFVHSFVHCLSSRKNQISYLISMVRYVFTVFFSFKFNFGTAAVTRRRRCGCCCGCKSSVSQFMQFSFHKKNTCLQKKAEVLAKIVNLCNSCKQHRATQQKTQLKANRDASRNIWMNLCTAG